MSVRQCAAALLWTCFPHWLWSLCVVVTVVRRVTLRECALLPGHSLSDCVGCTLDMFLSLSVMVIVIVVIV